MATTFYEHASTRSPVFMFMFHIGLKSLSEAGSATLTELTQLIKYTMSDAFTDGSPRQTLHVNTLFLYLLTSVSISLIFNNINNIKLESRVQT